jgi:hypothetical protein
LIFILTYAISELKLYIALFGFEVLNIMQAVAKEEWRWMF